MARPREFSETEVLDAAMETFWSQGYEATSVDDLVEATGLSRSSIYQAFGNKRELLEAALAHYVETRVARMLAGLESESAGLAEIEAFFGTLASIATDYPDRGALGCLMTNTIAELGWSDRELRSLGDGYIERLRVAFLGALENAEAGADVAPGYAESRARLLAAQALGSFVIVRGNDDASAIRATADAVSEQISGWRVNE